MQSFLISSKNKEEALRKAHLILDKINKIDIEKVISENVIGIENIRIIKSKIYLKPLISDFKAVIFDAYSGITIEAQNALLKILEEPPNNTVIIVIASTSEELLPTIISRCKLIYIKDSTNFASYYDEAKKILSELEKEGIGEKLKLAQDFGKTREEAILWLEKMIIILRKKMIDGISKGAIFEQNQIKILEKMQNTYTIIKTTNVNQRFALENLFLSLPSRQNLLSGKIVNTD